MQLKHTNFNIQTLFELFPHTMAGDDEGGPSLPTLGWVEDGDFIPLPNIILQSFMDCPVRSWDDDFTAVDRKRL